MSEASVKRAAGLLILRQAFLAKSTAAGQRVVSDGARDEKDEMRAQAATVAAGDARHNVVAAADVALMMKVGASAAALPLPPLALLLQGTRPPERR